jgi:hypothetical protein
MNVLTVTILPWQLHRSAAPSHLVCSLTSVCFFILTLAFLVQMVEVRPLTIRVDYLPRRIDLLSLRNGNYAELLNLVTWEGVELRLKGVRSAGVHGWSGLGAVLMNDWVEDISQNQVKVS